MTNDARILLVGFCSSISTLVTTITVISRIGPLIIPISLINIIASLAIEIKQNKLALQQTEKNLTYDRKLNYIHNIFYTKNYAADLKITKLKEYLISLYKNNVHNKIDIIIFYARKSIKFIIGSSIFSRFIDLIIVGYIVHRIITNNVENIGVYAGLLAAANSFLNASYRLFHLISDVSKINMFTERVRNFFDSTPIIETANNMKEYVLNNETIPISNTPLSVELINVSFSYPNFGFSLKNINLSIQPGEKVAIIGTNGAGKSTLIKLLLRLYDADSGEIYINKNSIQKYNVTNLRNVIGTVFQNVNIYALSIANNMNFYGEFNYSILENILEMIDMSYLLKNDNQVFDRLMTKEFDTDGLVLSGGETQKIGVSRIIGREFGLILLDEHSAHLDPIAENKVTKMLLSPANIATTIIITHRISTIKDADRIVVLKNGEIKEQGNHKELMEIRGEYYKLNNHQLYGNDARIN
jgi:ATP-binding cassette subfamily B protein